MPELVQQDLKIYNNFQMGVAVEEKMYSLVPFLVTVVNPSALVTGNAATALANVPIKSF